jgi:cell division septal protein FtsQ
MKRNRGRLFLRFFLFIAMLSTALGCLVYGLIESKALYQWLRTDPIFAVDEIKVVGNDLVDEAEIKILAGIERGENILAADLLTARDRLSIDRRFDRVFINRRFPNSIYIYLRERRPIALVKLDKLYAVDTNAELIPLQSAGYLPDLPVITGLMSQTPAALQRSPSDIEQFEVMRDSMLTNPNLDRGIYVVEMIKRFSPAFHDRISEINVVHPHDPVIYTVKDGLSIRLGIGRYSHKINMLNRTIHRLKKDGIKTRVIDLRFKDQVIVRPIVTTAPENKQS